MSACSYRHFERQMVVNMQMDGHFENRIEHETNRIRRITNNTIYIYNHIEYEHKMFASFKSSFSRFNHWLSFIKLSLTWHVFGRGHVKRSSLINFVVYELLCGFVNAKAARCVCINEAGARSGQINTFSGASISMAYMYDCSICYFM